MPKTKKLGFLLCRERWDEAYMVLLNTPNPSRHLPGGRNLLEEVCDRRAPPHLVDFVASLFPQDIVCQQAFSRAIRSSWRRASPYRQIPDVRGEAVNVLLQNLRESLNDDKKLLEESLLMTPYGQSTALYHASSSGADLDTIKALAETCPKALLVDNELLKRKTKTKLNTDCNCNLRMQPSLWSVLGQELVREYWSSPLQELSDMQSERWEKIQYLCLEAHIASPKSACPKHIKTNSPEKAKYILHAILGDVTSCFDGHDLFRVALQLCPRECLFAKDAKGWIPLHKYLWTSKGDHRLHKLCLQELLRIALETARIPTSRGRYPLHCAIRPSNTSARWDNGLGMVVSACGKALAIKGRNHCYPFQQAAACDADLDTIYRLLIAKPDLITQSMKPPFFPR